MNDNEAVLACNEAFLPVHNRGRNKIYPGSTLARNTSNVFIFIINPEGCCCDRARHPTVRRNSRKKKNLGTPNTPCLLPPPPPLRDLPAGASTFGPFHVLVVAQNNQLGRGVDEVGLPQQHHNKENNWMRGW